MVQQRCLRQFFFRQAKKGADQTIKVDQWATSSSTTLTTRCALKQCTSPSKPYQGNAWRRPCQATVAERRSIRLLFQRGANRARDISDMATE